MKPTRSEIRGTWMLAAVCAAALLAAGVADCRRSGREPAAIPLPEAVVPADSAAVADSAAGDPARRAPSGRNSSSGKSRNRRVPKTPAPDMPSPLDRPV